MIRRGRRIAGATLGLLLLAAPLGTGPGRAQTGSDDTFTSPAECSDPPPVPVENGISTSVVSPTGTDARTTPNVPIEASFTNESRRPIVNQPDGEISELRGLVLACEAGGIAPASPDAIQPEDEPRTASFAWSAEFPTNGRFAIVLEADGTSSDPDAAQSARVVVPVTLAVPPKKPTNVEVTDPANGIVTISWEYVDPEPDLFGFEIRRARQGSADYTTIRNGVVGPRARTVSDSPPVGAWRYQVVAYRQGAPEGAVSRDDTVEVAEASPTAAGDAPGTSGGSTGGSGTSGGSGGVGGTSTTATGGAAGSATAPGASVDLSGFAASLDARRNAPAARIEPPDPGFQETLPFNAPANLEVEDEPEELGADEPNVGLGQRPISDPGERRRSLGFVAFGLLLFVLSMTGLFLKSEVKRADLLDLDAVEDDPAPPDADASFALAAPPVVAAAASTRRRSTAVAAPEVGPEPERDVPARRRMPDRPVEPAAGLEVEAPGPRRRMTGGPVEPVAGAEVEAPARRRRMTRRPGRAGGGNRG